VVGDFCADMMINNSVLIESKAVRARNKAHEVQLVNYLVATKIETGLLSNFGEQDSMTLATFVSHSCNAVNPVNPV
jgi:GxxExxY protein